MKKNVDNILDRAIDGIRLEQDDIQTLFDHGGLLELASEPGKGTTVTLTLPLSND